MKEMMNKKSWEEFRDTGLLWFINTILHMFGWAIGVEIDEGKIVDAFPARVVYRGFSEELNDMGYRKVSKFLKDNVGELFNEAFEIEDEERK